MVIPQLVLLSEIDRGSPLFHNCLTTLASIDPQWPIERIIRSLDELKYDSLILTDGVELMAASCFNPGHSDGVVRVFLNFVSPGCRGNGFGAFIVAAMLRWAFDKNYNGAQVGLGRNAKTTGILDSLCKSIEFDMRFAKISPETGKVEFLRV